LINPVRNLCSRNDELKRYLHLEGIALHALGDARVDAGSLPLDTPLSALGEFTGVQGHARWAAEASGSAEPTIRDLAFVLGGGKPGRRYGGRDRLLPRGVARGRRQWHQRLSRNESWLLPGGGRPSVSDTAGAGTDRHGQVGGRCVTCCLAAATGCRLRTEAARHRRSAKRANGSKRQPTGWPRNYSG
jgi:hypothetical protein